MKSQKFYQVILAGSLATSLLCVGLTGSAVGQTVPPDGGAQEIQKAVEMWKEDDIALREEGTGIACSLLEREKKRIHDAVIEELGELAFATFVVDTPSKGEKRTKELESESPIYKALRAALGSADAEVRARAQDLLCEKCDACGTRFAEGLCPGCAPVFVLPEPEPEPEPEGLSAETVGGLRARLATEGQNPTAEAFPTAPGSSVSAKLQSDFARIKERRAAKQPLAETGPQVIVVLPESAEPVPLPRSASENVKHRDEAPPTPSVTPPGGPTGSPPGLLVGRTPSYAEQQRAALGLPPARPPGRGRTHAAPTEGTVSPWVRVQIAFQEKAPEQAIRELVLALQGTIVEGPTPVGVYTVELPIPREAAADLEPILQDLRGYTEVVRLVERQY